MKKEKIPNIIWVCIGTTILLFSLSYFSDFFFFCGWIACGFSILKTVNFFAGHFPPFISKAIHWIHAIAIETLILCVGFFTRFFAYVWKLETKSQNSAPILLIHGYMHNSSAWIYHKWKLSYHGFGPIYMMNLNHPFLSMNEYAKKVKQKALEIQKKTGRRDLILIGHSMGGIVSSLYATKLAEPHTVTQVITIGSPLSGTHLAKIALGPNGREMERGSPLLKQLQTDILDHPTTRFYHICTKTDQIVLPYTSGIIGQNLERSMILNDLGHLSLLYSPRVANQLIAWLTESTQNLPQ